jgi:hypothetical protein
MQDVTERCGQILGTSSTYRTSKEEKIYITTCVRKHLISELWLKEYCTCMTVFQHILAMLCEMFSITPVITDGLLEEDPLHGLHARQI